MNETKILTKLRQCFTNIVPDTDGRTGVSPLEFVVNFLFCYLGDTQHVSLESIRRFMKNQVQQNISRSAFWERISRNRLKNYLKISISELLKQFGTSVISGRNLLKKLDVTGILVVDSSHFTLWDGG